MKLMTLSFVSIVSFLVVGLVGCAGADQASEPSGATDSALHSSPNTVTLSAFTKAMGDEAQGMDSGTDDCSFSTKSTSSGLTLTVKDKSGTVTVVVDSQDAITHKDKADGDSSIETYTIAGVGTVVLTHADDAFEEISLTSSKTKKTASCEIDF
jgi:hypothetical protein